MAHWPPFPRSLTTTALALPLAGTLLGSCAGGDPAGGRERITISIEGAGGQTGGEGSCQPGTPTSLDFTAEQARALLAGESRTTLAHRPPHSALDTTSLAAEAGRPMTVSVTLLGEPRTEDHCGLRISQDVEVVLSLDDPPLDLVIQETADVFEADFAVLHAQLDPSVSALLGFPEATAQQQLDSGSGLQMVFHAEGVEGRLDIGGGPNCGEAVFPAGLRCPAWSQLEMEAQSEKDGFRPIDVVPAVEALSGTEIRWDDGTTTRLSFAVDSDPSWACHGQWIGGAACPYHVSVPLDVRVTSDDGQLDLLVPMQAQARVGTDRSAALCYGDTSEGWDGRLTLTSAAVLPADAGFGGALAQALTEAGTVAASVDFVLHGGPQGADEARLTVSAIAPHAGSPPIDAPIDADRSAGGNLGCFGAVTPLTVASSGAFAPAVGADPGATGGPDVGR